jgi:hypothetical protein
LCIYRLQAETLAMMSYGLTASVEGEARALSVIGNGRGP